VHGIDTQREGNWEPLLVREGREEGMFGATGPFSFAQHRAEIRPVYRPPIRQLLQRAPCRLEIGDSMGDELRTHRTSSL
jgi:hypothetical protein